MSDLMTRVRFHLADLVSAAHTCFANGSTLPGILLSYATMDIAASLTRPIGQPDTTGDDFKRWVEKYLLPGSRLNCSSADLWAARCGVLHTYSAASRLSRQGSAKMIAYVVGAMPPDHPSIRFGNPNSLAVHIVDFRDATHGAVDRFRDDLDTDAELAARVQQHAHELFVTMDYAGS